MLIRLFFSLLAGITSALIGWNIGQFFLTDLGWLKSIPEIALFPCIAISLAVGMVLNEFFISNPTRPKIILRIVKTPLLIAAGLGMVAGLFAGGISQILFSPAIPVPSPIVRMFGWLLIGSSVGLAEGLTWRWRSVEAGDIQRFWRRFFVSLGGASIASLVAALLFEIIRLLLGQIPDELKGFEDPLGFTVLGLLLGITFSVTNSPSYLAALRAGRGFEYRRRKKSKLRRSRPRINPSQLKFVSSSGNAIEEGLSIQLPPRGKITIGSGDRSSEEIDIYLPEIAPYAAEIEQKAREAIFIPNQHFFKAIEVNGKVLKHPVTLKHNTVLTFYGLTEEGEINEGKIYRFIYYNRFLDPQA